MMQITMSLSFGEIMA